MNFVASSCLVFLIIAFVFWAFLYYNIINIKDWAIWGILLLVFIYDITTSLEVKYSFIKKKLLVAYWQYACLSPFISAGWSIQYWTKIFPLKFTKIEEDNYIGLQNKLYLKTKIHTKQTPSYIPEFVTSDVRYDYKLTTQRKMIYLATLCMTFLLSVTWITIVGHNLIILPNPKTVESFCLKNHRTKTKTLGHTLFFCEG